MRNDLIDIMRGFAFILMLVHHFFNFNPNNKIMPLSVSVCGTISRTIFIILVGTSIQMFKNKKKKSITPYKTLFCALFVTLLTRIILNETNVIFFGTLHFISFVTIIFQHIEFNNKEQILGIIVSLFLSNYILNNLNPSDNYINLILGTYTKSTFPLDIFPIFKWLPYVFFGMIIGDYMKDNNINLEVDNFYILKFFGKNSLFFYMLHIIPCIIWYGSK